jgi:hypothetical protein
MKMLFFVAMAFAASAVSWAQASVQSSDVVVQMNPYQVVEDPFWEAWMPAKGIPTQWKGETVISRLFVSKLKSDSPLYHAGLRNGMEIFKIQNEVASGNTIKKFNELVSAQLSKPDVKVLRITVRDPGKFMKVIQVPIEVRLTANGGRIAMRSP